MRVAFGHLLVAFGLLCLSAGAVAFSLWLQGIELLPQNIASAAVATIAGVATLVVARRHLPPSPTVGALHGLVVGLVTLSIIAVGAVAPARWSLVIAAGCFVVAASISVVRSARRRRSLEKG